MASITAEQAGSENMVRFLDLIAFSEGTSTDPLAKKDGYDVIVSGIEGPEVFTDYSDHPFAKGRAAKVIRRVPFLTSSASGRYQLELKWWRAYQPMLGLKDFSPISQDRVAIRQIKERLADAYILKGEIERAVRACSSIWASLPGNHYGQGGKSMQALLEKFEDLKAEIS
jgi:muramidase (phage lysozyme)